MASESPIKPKKKSPIILILPSLGQDVTDDGPYQTETYKLTTKTTVREMKERLGAYGQDVGGNREELISRLIAFAENEPEWKILFHPKQKRKRGDATGTRAQCHSAKRIAIMFTDPSETTSITYASKHDDIDRPGAVAMSEFQVAQLDNWTDAVLMSYALGSGMPPSPPSKVPDIGAHPSDIVPDPPVKFTPESTDSTDMLMRRNLRRFENLTLKFEHRIDSIRIPIPGLSIPQLSVAAVPGPSALPARTTHALHAQPVPHTLPFDLHSPSPQVYQAMTLDGRNSSSHGPGTIHASLPPAPPWTPMVPAQSETSLASQTQPMSQASIPAENRVSIAIGDEQLTFDASQIPDPPRRHYSQDIPGLFREWDAGSLLKIDGRTIPLKYWPVLYQKRNPKRRGKVDKEDAWDLMKVEYGNWRWLVEERDRLGSEDAFWAAHSDSTGARLQYSQILRRLKSRRTGTYREDAQAARTYFGGNLSRADAGDLFKYKRGTQMVELSKDEAIAKQWRKLLESNQIVAAKWEAMRAEQVAATRPPPSFGHQ